MAVGFCPSCRSLQGQQGSNALVSNPSGSSAWLASGAPSEALSPGGSAGGLSPAPSIGVTPGRSLCMRCGDPLGSPLEKRTAEAAERLWDTEDEEAGESLEKKIDGAVQKGDLIGFLACMDKLQAEKNREDLEAQIIRTLKARNLLAFASEWYAASNKALQKKLLESFPDLLKGSHA